MAGDFELSSHTGANRHGRAVCVRHLGLTMGYLELTLPDKLACNLMSLTSCLPLHSDNPRLRDLGFPLHLG